MSLSISRQANASVVLARMANNRETTASGLLELLDLTAQQARDWARGRCGGGGLTAQQARFDPGPRPPDEGHCRTQTMLLFL